MARLVLIVYTLFHVQLSGWSWKNRIGKKASCTDTRTILGHDSVPSNHPVTVMEQFCHHSFVTQRDTDISFERFSPLQSLRQWPYNIRSIFVGVAWKTLTNVIVWVIFYQFSIKLYLLLPARTPSDLLQKWYILL